ncbi:MAG: efflux RND transporter periplasmic adaptor subunit, partial [Chitinophagaceae bacterium]|nr:efflux RND transporter periplasmic adaptor subunit [Chitinophagaceae bacterium]
MFKNKKFWIVIFIALSLSFTLFKIFKKETAISVAVQEVIQQNIVETVYASGKIYPSVERKVYAESAGTIIKILVNEGQNVQKGQILFTLKTVNSNPIFYLP